MGDELYKDESWLREQYTEKGRTQADIGEQFGVAQGNVGYYINKYGIEEPGPDTDQHPWKGEKYLRREYVEKERSMPDIADEWDVYAGQIRYWMQEYEIPRRSNGESNTVYSRQSPAGHRFTYNEHTNRWQEKWQCDYEGERERLPVHRLLAVSKFGFEEVCDNHVHHINGLQLDNREENLDLMSLEEHNSIHHLSNHEQHPTNINNPSHL